MTMPSGTMKILPAIDQSIQRTKELLFRPFNLEIWLRLGFIIFLAELFRGGFSFGFRWPIGEWPEMPRFNDNVVWLFNQPLLYAIGIPVLVFIVLLGVLFVWLRSYGDVMFVRAAVTGRTGIGENWQVSGKLAQSLFLFRLALYVISLATAGSLLIFMLVHFVRVAENRESNVWDYINVLLFPFLWFLVIALTLWTVELLLRDFVVPLMWHFGENVKPAWRRFGNLARNNILAFFLFYLVKFLYGIVLGIIMILVGCMTCCIGFLPYVNNVLFSPLFLFDRLYGIYVLSSAGPEYEMIRETPPPVPDLPAEPPTL